MRNFLITILFFVAAMDDRVAAQDSARAKIKILLPVATIKEPEVKVEGVLTKSTGAVRKHTTPRLVDGKTYAYRIEARFEPNNFTSVIRSREITFKAGDDLTVDLRNKDENYPDDIRIRWIQTPRDVVKEMGKLARIGETDVVCDLGCGDGIMVITAVKEMKARKGIGIDVDPKRVTEARANAKAAGIAERIEIREGNILDVTARDIGDVSVIMIYMGEEINLRLRPKLWSSLKPGSRIVSHRFSMGDWRPEKSITVRSVEGGEFDLHLWTITGKETDGSYNKKDE